MNKLIIIKYQLGFIIIININVIVFLKVVVVRIIRFLNESFSMILGLEIILSVVSVKKKHIYLNLFIII